MRKATRVLAAVTLIGLTASVSALPQESILFWDIRDNAAGGIQSITSPPVNPNPFLNGQGEAIFSSDTGPSGGGPGSGQVLRLCPVMTNAIGPAPLATHLGPSYPNFDGDSDASTGVLHLYYQVDPNNDLPATTGDVMSAIGIDVQIQRLMIPTGFRYQIVSSTFAWTVPTQANIVALNGTPQAGGIVGHTGCVYVFDPHGGTYTTVGGMTPGLVAGDPAHLYKVADLTVVAGPRACDFTTPGTYTHAAESTWRMTTAINQFRITREFNTGGNAVPDERVSLGYVGGALETDVSGNVVGSTFNVWRDAVIQVRLKHDTDGDGTVTGLDMPGFIAATVPPNNQTQLYLYDRNNSGTVTAADLVGPNGYVAFSLASCP